MSLSINKCLIAGKVTDAGVRLTYGENGTPEAYWTLMVDETGANGMTFTTFIPCRAWGKSAETIAEQMDAGDVVFIGDGKLKFRSWTTKSGEKKTRLEVTTWAVQILEKASAESVH
jgi:single-stranded DNA-binding protein